MLLTARSCRVPITITENPKGTPVKVRDHIDDKYSLSPMQQGMLFHTLYDQRLGL